MGTQANLWHAEELSDGRVIRVLRAKAHVNVAVSPGRVEVPLAFPERTRTSALTRSEKREMNRLLNRWGNWVEAHLDFVGYPGINILEAYIGSDPGIPGHRILCLEMPHDVYCTHQRILRLSEHEREAIWIWYVPRIRPNGTVFSIAELCEKAGISEVNLRKRVSRARMRIAGVLPT